VPSDQGGRFLDEEAAVRAVLAAVEDGLERMQAAADRLLARRSPTELDSRFLAEMERSLAGLADQFSEKAVDGGKYGKLLEAAFRKGAGAGDGAMIRVDRETIRKALWPAQVKIKDLMEDGSRAITELTARAMIAGWSARELSERIQKDVTLGGESPYSVPEWRAELQARNEPMKVYRETAAAGWTDDTLLEMFGPDDARTKGDICSTYLGRVMTLKEWREVGADPTGYGFHPNCRHRWLKVEGDEPADLQLAGSMFLR
jgi:hypothetical protein